MFNISLSGKDIFRLQVFLLSPVGGLSFMKLYVGLFCSVCMIVLSTHKHAISGLYSHLISLYFTYSGPDFPGEGNASHDPQIRKWRRRQQSMGCPPTRREYMYNAQSTRTDFLWFSISQTKKTDLPFYFLLECHLAHIARVFIGVIVLWQSWQAWSHCWITSLQFFIRLKSANMDHVFIVDKLSGRKGPIFVMDQKSATQTDFHSDFLSKIK